MMDYVVEIFTILGAIATIGSFIISLIEWNEKNNNRK